MRSGKAVSSADYFLGQARNGVNRLLFDQFSQSLKKATFLRTHNKAVDPFLLGKNIDQSSGLGGLAIDLGGIDIASILREDSENGLLRRERSPAPLGPLKDTQRYLMYKAIHRKDPEGVWRGFDGILKNNEWRKVTEYDIIRVIQTLNMQYAFERKPETLRRLRVVRDACKKNKLKFTTIWALNELIRLHVAEGQHEEALSIKNDIDSGTYGPNMAVNVHTYAALFSDPTAESLPDLIKLTDLFDEMLGRNIAPNAEVEKSLIKAAQKVDEFRLLDALLESTKDGNFTDDHGNLFARYTAARGQAYLALHAIRPALAELHKLLSFRIPSDKRQIPHALLANPESTNIAIPLELAGTRDAYFVYLRSLYESIIRICIIRRQIKRASELLDELRKNCYLPPTQTAYRWFVRFHAKRKNIKELVDIQDMMLRDGVPLNEHIYTKFITSCMFTPKTRLLSHIVKSVSSEDPAGGIHKEACAQIGGIRKVNLSAKFDTGVNTHIDSTASEEKSTPRKSGLPVIPKNILLTEKVAEHVYYPSQCIRFFEDMLLEYNAKPSDIRDVNYKPNVSITNAVMRAYLMLESPALALREFHRYCIHQRTQNPSSVTPDVQTHKRTLLKVFGMADEAASILGDRLEQQRIETNMVEWGLQPLSSNH
ncbi:hypothetical protein BX661DRAFT_178078 [Kickxella alabastrina]|uniref:uncharacterized protein n=1 Tax=Kickxella alabastrina TaxID=61397 RepID=UPI00221F56CD|nr:uncharacterized protein BX661DRAFT_178078 [Kickxella alabastrina]KAI7833290.1 hypothetical protein BX661DRAFT_178078 [Kickxella alabastrina]